MHTCVPGGKPIFIFFFILIFSSTGETILTFFLSNKPASVRFHVQIHDHDQCCDSIKALCSNGDIKQKKTLLLPVIVQQIVPF